MQICHKSFFHEIQIKIPSEIKPGENYMRVIRLVEGCHQLSWLSDSIRAQNERGISDIRAVGIRGQRGRLTPPQCLTERLWQYHPKWKQPKWKFSKKIFFNFFENFEKLL